MTEEERVPVSSAYLPLERCVTQAREGDFPQLLATSLAQVTSVRAVRSNVCTPQPTFYAERSETVPEASGTECEASGAVGEASDGGPERSGLAPEAADGAPESFGRRARSFGRGISLF